MLAFGQHGILRVLCVDSFIILSHCEACSIMILYFAHSKMLLSGMLHRFKRSAGGDNLL